MNIINLDQLISMTSLEIAELTGKRHDNVIRDVRKMLEELNGLSFEGVNEVINHKVILSASCRLLVSLYVGTLCRSAGCDFRMQTKWSTRKYE